MRDDIAEAGWPSYLSVQKSARMRMRSPRGTRRRAARATTDARSSIADHAPEVATLSRTSFAQVKSGARRRRLPRMTPRLASCGRSRRSNNSPPPVGSRRSDADWSVSSPEEPVARFRKLVWLKKHKTKRLYVTRFFARRFVFKATNESGSLAKHETAKGAELTHWGRRDSRRVLFFRLVHRRSSSSRVVASNLPHHLSAANESVVRTSQHTAIHQSGKTIQMAFATITVATLPRDAPTSYRFRR